MMHDLLVQFYEWYGMEVHAGRCSSLTGMEMASMRLFCDWAVENAPEYSAVHETLDALEETVDIIIWMSGSRDFSPGGAAYEGWLKVHPRIGRWKNTIAKAKGPEGRK